MTTKAEQVQAEAYDILPKIQEFDIVKEFDKVRNFSCVIWGKRRMGKTHIAKDLLRKIRKWYKEIHVFSTTAYLQPDTFDFIPKQNIHQGFDPEAITEIWTRQKNYILEEVAKGRKKESLDIVMLLFDDIIQDPKVRNCPAYNEIFIAGRHVNLASITLSQEFGGKYGIPKVVRANLDLVISFFPNSEVDRESIVKQYLSTKNKQVGHIILREICDEEYQAIVICNFKTTLDLPSYVFRYKAQAKIPKYMIGDKNQPFTSREILRFNEDIFGEALGLNVRREPVQLRRRL